MATAEQRRQIRDCFAVVPDDKRMEAMGAALECLDERIGQARRNFATPGEYLNALAAYVPAAGANGQVPAIDANVRSCIESAVLYYAPVGARALPAGAPVREELLLGETQVQATSLFPSAARGTTSSSSSTMLLSQAIAAPAPGPCQPREQQQVPLSGNRLPVSVPPSTALMTSEQSNASVADNRCPCGWSRKQLYLQLQVGKAVSPVQPHLGAFFCDTVFESNWRGSNDPKCISGDRPLSEHPQSRCAEHVRTMSIQLAVLAGQLLLSIGLGMYLAEEGKNAGSGAATLEHTLRTVAFSMMVVTSLKHMLEVVRACIVRWPNSVRYAVVAGLPLIISAACIAVAVLTESAVLLALACSASGVYLSELMSAVAAWKRQRIDREVSDADVARLLKAAPRSAAVLTLGSVTPVLLVVPLWVLSGASSAQKYLFVLGLLLWALPIMYVLLELKAWHSFVPDRLEGKALQFRTPVLGTTIFITPDEPPSQERPATRAPF